MWPELVDLQTYWMPVGHQWVFADSPPQKSWSFRVQAGWSKDPLWAVQLHDSDPYPMVGNLLHLNSQITWEKNGMFAVATLPASAIWNGHVGLSDLQAGMGYGSHHVQFKALATLPTTTQPSELDPSSQYVLAATVQGGNNFSWVLQSNGVYRDTLGWIVSSGLGYHHLKVESRIEKSSSRQLCETSLSYTKTWGVLAFQPSFTWGWWEGPGNPKVRALVSISYVRPENKPEPITAPPVVEPVAIVEPINDAVSSPPTDDPEVKPPESVVPSEMAPSPTPEPVSSPLPEIAPVPVELSPPAKPPANYESIAQLVDVLRLHPEITKVRLEVHTSCEGSRVTQMARSQKAADQIRAYLLGQGVTEERLETVAMGASKPLSACPEKTEQSRKANRRVDAKVIEVQKKK